MNEAVAVYSADLDGDGDNDVVAVAQDENNAGIAWWENEGSGSNWSDRISIADFDYATDVIAVDIDNDGDIDIVASADGSLDDIAWWKNNGSGSFTKQSNIDSDFNGVWEITAADLDNDGDLDIIGAAKDENQVAWWQNNGNGTFGSRNTIQTSFDAISVFVEDFNNDGYLDIASASFDGNNISWWANNLVTAEISSFSSTSDTEGTSKSFTISLDREAPEDITVTYNISGVSSSDYSGLSGEINFSEGEDSQTISFEIEDDDIYEKNETLTITLTDNDGYIHDGDSVSFTIKDYLGITANTDATEDGSDGKFTIITDTPQDTIELNFSVDGTAERGVDYQLYYLANGEKQYLDDDDNNFPITDEAESLALYVEPINDTIFESDETITISLESGDDYNVISDTTAFATLTLTDNEPIISIGDIVNPTENEIGYIELELNNPVESQAGIRVKYRILDDSTATFNQDYYASQSRLTTDSDAENAVFIPQNATTAKLYLTALPDVEVAPEGGLNIRYSVFNSTATSGVDYQPLEWFIEQVGSENPFDSVDVGTFSDLSLVDIDKDGDLDAFIGNSYGTIEFFKNYSIEDTGLAGVANFEEEIDEDNPLSGFDVGSYSSIDFVDIDDDGDFDAFVGNSDGEIIFYQNTGDESSASFSLVTGEDNPLDEVGVGGYAVPSFVDIDSDGDKDVFIGNEDGEIIFYQNTGDESSAIFTLVTGSDNPFDGFDGGDRTSPSFIDIDEDNDFDAFIGNGEGEILYFNNTGNAVEATYVEQTGIANLFVDSEGETVTDIGSNSMPTFGDIDDDGDLDAFFGEVYGRVLYYQNFANNEITIQEGSDSAIIEVYPIADNIAENDETVTVILNTNSGYYLDAEEGISGTVTILDNDTPQLIITDSDGNQISDDDNFATAENNSNTQSFFLSLATQPTDTVIVYINSNDDSEGILNTNTLYFTTDNWNQTQEVILSSVDDVIQDGDIDYQIVTNVVSEDDFYDDIETQSINITNQDDSDTAEVIVNQIDEYTYSIELATQPLGDVFVTMTPDNQISLNNRDAGIFLTLIFNENNWNDSQTVVVNTQDDYEIEYNHGGEIEFAVSSNEDTFYDEVTPPENIDVLILDNDKPTVNIRVGDGVEEEASPGYFTITLSEATPDNNDGDSGFAISYQLLTDESTTTNGGDYQEILETGLIYIPAGSNTGNLFIQPIDDYLVEGFDILVTTAYDSDSGEVSLIIDDEDIDSYTIPANNTLTFSNGVIATLPEAITLSNAESTAVSVVLANGDDISISETSRVVGENLTIQLSTGDSYEIDNNRSEAILQIIDNDTPGLRIVQRGDRTQVTEGNTGNMQISLLSQPTDDVTITFTTDSEIEEISSLNFTPDNWYQLQSIDITAIDENVAETDKFHLSTLEYLLSSNDDDYNDLEISPQILYIQDRLLDTENTYKGLQSALNALQKAQDKLSIPILGQLEGVVPDFIQLFQDDLIENIQTTSQLTTWQLEQILQDILGNYGLSVVTEITDIETTFTVTVSESYEDVTFEVADDLGMSALGVSYEGTVVGDISYDGTLVFVLGKDGTFYLDTENTIYDVDVDLELEELEGSGSLGFVKVDFEDDPNTESVLTLTGTVQLTDENLDDDGLLSQQELALISYTAENDTQTFFEEYTNYDLIGDATLGLSAIGSLDRTIYFPTFNFDLYVDFPLFNYADETISAADESEFIVEINDLELDLGTYVTNYFVKYLDQIDNQLQPIYPILDTFNTDTKFLSYLKLDDLYDYNNDGKVSLAELTFKLLGGSGEADNLFDFLDNLEYLISLVELGGEAVDSYSINYYDSKKTDENTEETTEDDGKVVETYAIDLGSYEITINAASLEDDDAVVDFIRAFNC